MEGSTIRSSGGRQGAGPLYGDVFVGSGPSRLPPASRTYVEEVTPRARPGTRVSSRSRSRSREIVRVRERDRSRTRSPPARRRERRQSYYSDDDDLDIRVRRAPQRPPVPQSEEPAIQAHSTISKDQTGGLEANERNLLMMLASKYNVFQESTLPQQSRDSPPVRERILERERIRDDEDYYYPTQGREARYSSRYETDVVYSSPLPPPGTGRPRRQAEPSYFSSPQPPPPLKESWDSNGRTAGHRRVQLPDPSAMPSPTPPLLDRARNFSQPPTPNGDYQDISTPVPDQEPNNQAILPQKNEGQDSSAISTEASSGETLLGTTTMSSLQHNGLLHGRPQPSPPQSISARANASARPISRTSTLVQGHYDDRGRRASSLVSSISQPGAVLSSIQDVSGQQMCPPEDAYPAYYEPDPQQFGQLPQRPRKRRTYDNYPPLDWRSMLCKLLQLPPNVPDEALLSTADIRAKKMATTKRTTSNPSLSNPYHLIHRVYCADSGENSYYLETPWAVNSGENTVHLRGGKEIKNLELHIERHKNLAFLVYNQYTCCNPIQSSGNKPGQNQEQDTEDVNMYKSGESVCVISQAFHDMLLEIRSKERESIQGYYPNLNAIREFYAPYLWLYHDRESIKKQRPGLSRSSQQLLDAFLDYINTSLGEEYDEVDDLVSKGLISMKYTPYLFIPKSVIFYNDPASKPSSNKGYQATAWLRPSPHSEVPAAGGPAKLAITVIFWKFDGFFQTEFRGLQLETGDTPAKPIKITDLKFFPMKFADPRLVAQLRKEGQTFWNCRKRCYVCYSDDKQIPGENNGDLRYMIDIGIYKKMHISQNTVDLPNHDELGPEIMASDTPPGDNFTLLLPSTLVGFNMQEKKWVDLEVGRISPVTWNKKAFESLVLEDNTKILITALVTNQIAAEESTDLMSGKGNGLIVLLHGGPGTGKTLTAESVAEIAEKPLYRVTCGDIGTNPEAVEKYLETVLYLGKVWECVVLLDEADVFLEQRTLADLQRNALVSVFLRVLEYYDGILVLTSNRVGTFDEAFKSRIQLSLRYENLTETQRHKVWENFINRLETFEPPHQQISSPESSSIISQSTPTINIAELRQNLPALAKYNMNGRQIRNAVTTARQLALYKQKPMGYEELIHVIGVAGKFDAYLLEVHENLDGDAIARDSGDR